MNFIKFILHVSLFSFVLMGGSYIFQEYISGTNDDSLSKLNDLPEELRNVKDIEKIINMDYFSNKSELENENYFAMLLLGIDDNNFEGSRTDSIIIAIVNKESKKVSLVSIPRDYRVKIYKTERYDKINSAFAYGGIDLTAATIEENFGIPIHYYSIINFKGFQDLVGALGGIDIDVEKDISFSDRITGTTFKLSEGTQTLSGIEALNYSRYRSDGEGDFGRMRRQQQVVGSIAEQTLSFRSVPKLTKIYQAVENNFKTNVNFTDITLLALKLRSMGSEGIEVIPFKTFPSSHSGISYVESEEQEVSELKLNLRKLLNGENISTTKNSSN
jgi:LCP family protein required for cell wall assembly